MQELRDQAKNGPVDMSIWAGYFSFDIMGEIGLGKDFNSVEEGLTHKVMRGVMDVAVVVSYYGMVPWMLNLMSKLPKAAPEGYMKFFDHCNNQVQAQREKIQPGVAPEDVLSYLVAAQWEGDKSAPPAEALPEDARTLIIAGSETSTSLLACAFYHLLRHPDYLKRLMAELEERFPNGDADWESSRVKDVPLIDNVFWETLRLSPGVPDGLNRVTPPEGVMVDDVFIPGDTIVSAPLFSIQRDGRYWDEPLEFKPDRWNKLSPETHPAYAPFTLGPYVCPGRNIGKMEFRMFLSRVLLNFDMSFADPKAVETWEARHQNHFTVRLPPLMINMTPR
jgi:cytochrome P450